MNTDDLALDPGPAVGFRQEPATAGPGLPVTTNTAMKGKPMVEAATGTVTITVPSHLHARAESTHAAYARALKLATDHPTAAHARALSATRSRLASVYRELASLFGSSVMLFEALDHMAAQHFADAIDDARWAERLEASTFGGDAE